MAQVQAPKKKKDDWVDVPSDEGWEDVPTTPPVVTPPVNTAPPTINQPALPEKASPGFLESVWNAVNEPTTDLPSRIGKKVSAYIDPSHGSSGLRSTASAFAESLGDTLSGLSSPLNLGLTLATAGSGAAAKTGLTRIAEGLNTAGKVVSAPVAAHGAYKVATGDTLEDKLMGGVELVGGGFGMRSKVPTNTPEIRSKGKLSKIADNVIKPEEVPHDFNQGIDFITDESGRPLAPNTGELVRPEGPWSMNEGPSNITSRSTYDPYQSILEKQGKGELKSRPSDVPSKKNPVTESESTTSEQVQPTTITIKKPSKELTASLREQGYESAGVSPEGYPMMKLKSNETNIAEKTGIQNETVFESIGNKVSEGITDEIPPNVGETLPQYTERTKLDPVKAKEIFDTYEVDEIPPQVSNEFTPPEAVKASELTPTDDIQSALKASLEQTNPPIEPTKPVANFAFHQDDFQGGSLPLYNIEAEGHPLHRSTVSAETLKEAGIDVPETPPFDPSARPNKPLTVEAIKATIPNDKIPAAIGKVAKQTELLKMAPAKEKESLYRKIMDTQRALLTGFDVSFLGRQGKGLITHKGYWNALDDMWSSLGSQRASEVVRDSIIDHPSGWFKPKTDIKGNAIQSYAEKVGLDLPGVFNKGTEENLHSSWANRIPGYKQTNRANTAFITKARSDVFASLMDELVRRGENPNLNIDLGRKIADSVNVSSGRGSFGKLEHPILNTETKELEASKAMKVLNEIFFAPKFAASRVQMFSRVLDPRLYYKADPIIRNEALRSLLGVVGTGLLVQELARQVGATIINDPTNPDFRKIKIGDSRIDNFSGLGPYGVGTAQFLMGQKTSSLDEKTRQLVGGFGKTPTKRDYGKKSSFDLVSDFAVNRAAPIPSLLISWMRGKDFDGQPFEWKNAIARRTAPLLAQDLYDLQKKDPSLLPMGVLPLIGEGIQTYGR